MDITQNRFENERELVCLKEIDGLIVVKMRTKAINELFCVCSVSQQQQQQQQQHDGISKLARVFRCDARLRDSWVLLFHRWLLLQRL